MQRGGLVSRITRVLANSLGYVRMVSRYHDGLGRLTQMDADGVVTHYSATGRQKMMRRGLTPRH